MSDSVLVFFKELHNLNGRWSLQLAYHMPLQLAGERENTKHAMLQKRASKHCHRQKKWKGFEEIPAQRLTGLREFLSLNTHQIVAGVNEKEMPTKNYTAKS